MSMAEPISYKFTVWDHIQQHVWYVLLWACLHYSESWIYGTVIFFVAFYLITGGIEKVFDCELAGVVDELVFGPDERGIANIVAFQRCQKIDDVDAFKQTMLKRITKFSRFRSHVHKYLGRYWFKTIPESEVRA